MLKTFDLDKLFNLNLDPPSSENLPLCRITQDGRDPIITTDFYLINVEPREWILPTSLTNNEAATSNAAAANNSTSEIAHDPLQPGELDYTPGSYILQGLQFWICDAKRLLQH